jgi:N-acetylneuraminic acid mutarotase
MHAGRTGFSICAIGHYIYVMGGADQNLDFALYSTDKYCVLNCKWTKLSCQIPIQFVVQMTAVPIKGRYIYTFGGCDEMITPPKHNIEHFLRLDTVKEKWESLRMENPDETNGFMVGAIPLGALDDHMFEFVVFGGVNNGEFNKRTCIFTTKIDDF